jgi:hypothetical protein
MIMFDHARKMGADIRMGVRVERYDDTKPSIVLASGEEIYGDIIIGADGNAPRCCNLTCRCEECSTNGSSWIRR